MLARLRTASHCAQAATSALGLDRAVAAAQFREVKHPRLAPNPHPPGPPDMCTSSGSKLLYRFARPGPSLAEVTSSKNRLNRMGVGRRYFRAAYCATYLLLLWPPLAPTGPHWPGTTQTTMMSVTVIRCTSLCCKVQSVHLRAQTMLQRYWVLTLGVQPPLRCRRRRENFQTAKLKCLSSKQFACACLDLRLSGLATLCKDSKQAPGVVRRSRAWPRVSKARKDLSLGPRG